MPTLENIYERSFNSTEWGKAIGLKKLQIVSSELWFIVPKYEVVPPGELWAVLSEYTQIRHNRRASQALDATLLWTKSKLEWLYERWKWETIMVRSNSQKEDGKNSFAWVYKSVKVKCDSVEDLVKAFQWVQASLNSSLAQAYRYEHKIWFDEMGIVIQEFIDGIPNWYGVIHTAFPNSKYNSDFFISGWSHESVTDGRTNTWNADQWKDSTYISSGIPKDIQPYVPQIQKIVVGLEEKYGKSDIEFVIWQDHQVYIVQLRPLNYKNHAPMLDGSEQVTRLDKWSMANFKWLPVLVVESFENLIMQGIKNPLNIPEWEWYWDHIESVDEDGKRLLIPGRQALVNPLHLLIPDLKYESAMATIDSIINFNKAHPNGYILCIQNWLPEWFGGLSRVIWWKRELWEKALFSNRKAMIVTAFQSTYSNELAHKSIRAREENIPVIQIKSRHGERNPVQLQTGDIISIRDGYLVRDKKVSDITVENPKDFYKGIHIRDTQEWGKEILFPGSDEVNLTVFYKFLQNWLSHKTWVSWNLKEHAYSIRASFTDETRELDITGFRMCPKYWALYLTTEWQNLWLQKALMNEFRIPVDNNKYPEDFEEEIY
jgi:Pyruvate phosphate dikinase, AMP/ATP-binding domain